MDWKKIIKTPDHTLKGLFGGLLIFLIFSTTWNLGSLWDEKEFHPAYTDDEKVIALKAQGHRPRQSIDGLLFFKENGYPLRLLKISF